MTLGHKLGWAHFHWKIKVMQTAKIISNELESVSRNSEEMTVWFISQRTKSKHMDSLTSWLTGSLHSDTDRRSFEECDHLNL